MLKLIVFTTFLLFGVSAEVDINEPLIGRNCTSGEVGKAEIKWFWDHGRMKGYPYKYWGCGDTDGYEFDKLPIIMDHSGCPGYYTQGGDCKIDRSFPSESKNCKEDHYCLPFPMAEGHGRCCSSVVKAKFEENRKAKCPVGESAATFRENTLFGKKCSHNFCPTSSKCIDGEFEAYCCERIKYN